MLRVKDIIDICNGEFICGDMEIVCQSFIIDSRKVVDGSVFVGIKGDNFDGNDFYLEAFKNGARVCILNRDSYQNKKENKKNTIILVDDTLDAIQKIAKYKRSLYNIPVIAVTGSVGKTSVKDMICSVLKNKYNVLSTMGNMNNHLGVPLTILNLDNHDALVVEMGMNHFNELHVLSNIAKPTLAVITNIGTAHIGNLGSRENILRAKLEILDGMNDGFLFINNDNDLLRTVKYDNLITVGIENKSDYMAYDISLGAFESEFMIDGEFIKLKVGSIAFIYNALFAYAIGIKLGVEREKIIDSLEGFANTPHRLEVISNDSYTIIDDTYNASLDSVSNSLNLLAKVSSRKVFIFADILEVSGFEKEIHEDVARCCMENNIDVVICVGKFAKYTFDFLENDSKYYFENNEQLFKKIDDIIDEDDTILVKGSHGMNLLEVVEYLKTNIKN